MLSSDSEDDAPLLSRAPMARLAAAAAAAATASGSDLRRIAPSSSGVSRPSQVACNERVPGWEERIPACPCQMRTTRARALCSIIQNRDLGERWRVVPF